MRRRLTLVRETLGTLDAAELASVAGGATDPCPSWPVTVCETLWECTASLLCEKITARNCS